MAVNYIHTYLVYPAKTTGIASQITGSKVELTGKLFEMLNGVYEGAEKECNIEIVFNPRSDGMQSNACRDLVTAYAQTPSVPRGRRLAERLEQVTTNRSGLGLFFLIRGREGSETKIVISRFPADNGILAEEKKKELSVQFLERIFMKSAYSYKAVLYQGSSFTGDFWTGRCVDKQINDPIARISDYWIHEFLDSRLATTAAAGTYRLAVALRSAARTTKDLSIKSEIAAAVTLAGGFKGRRVTIEEFAQQSNLSLAATEAIIQAVGRRELASERFLFDHSEFVSQLPYRSIELDSGAIVTAEASQFDSVVKRENLDDTGHIVRLSVQGAVTSENLKKIPQ